MHSASSLHFQMARTFKPTDCVIALTKLGRPICKLDTKMISKLWLKSFTFYNITEYFYFMEMLLNFSLHAKSIF